MLTIYIRLVGRAALVLAVMVLGLIAILRSQPLADLGTGFDLCVVPCWAGIEPGRTLYADAPEIAARYFTDTQILYFNSYMQVYTPLVNVVGVVGVGDGMVDSIRLNAAQPLWATLIMLGTPLCIELIDPQFSPGLMNIFWTIDDVHVMVTVNTSRRNPVIQTNVVQLWADSSAVNCWTEENLLPWPGSAKFLFHG